MSSDVGVPADEREALPAPDPRTMEPGPPAFPPEQHHRFDALSRLRRSILQTFAFARKEVVEVLRQPRLVGMLAFGPFVVLLLFGVGYRSALPKLRAVVVAPAGSPFVGAVERYREQFADRLQLVEVTPDEARANQMLDKDRTDLVIILPADPIGELEKDQRVPIVLRHAQLDPIVQTAISFAANATVEEINTQVIGSVVGEAQARAKPVSDNLGAVQQGLEQAAIAERSGDTAGARAARERVSTLLGDLSATGGAARLAESLGASSSTGAQVTAGIDQIRQGVDGGADLGTLATQVADLRRSVDQLGSVDPKVLARPFEAKVEVVGADVRNVTDYYAPGAVAVLLQHIGLSFGALAMVRERQYGFGDVLSVSPTSAVAVVLGKLIGYAFIGGVLAAVLLGALQVALGVPMAGSWADLALVLALVVLASTVLGLLISLVTTTDPQAVQGAMLVLLASLFFTGFFLPIEQLAPITRPVSEVLPATHGIQLLHDVMLRGRAPSPGALGALIALFLVPLALSWTLTRRRLLQRR